MGMQNSGGWKKGGFDTVIFSQPAVHLVLFAGLSKRGATRGPGKTEVCIIAGPCMH